MTPGQVPGGFRQAGSFPAGVPPSPPAAHKVLCTLVWPGLQAGNPLGNRAAVWISSTVGAAHPGEASLPQGHLELANNPQLRVRPGVAAILAQCSVNEPAWLPARQGKVRGTQEHTGPLTWVGATRLAPRRSSPCSLGLPPDPALTPQHVFLAESNRARELLREPQTDGEQQGGRRALWG